jgi:hypothetical protein
VKAVETSLQLIGLGAKKPDDNGTVPEGAGQNAMPERTAGAKALKARTALLSPSQR